VEVVVVNPGALGHVALARPVHLKHLAFGALIAECVVVDFDVVAEYREIAGPTPDGKFEGVSRDSAVMDAGFELHFAGLVLEDEALNYDICGGACQPKAGLPGNLDAADRLGRDNDWVLCRSGRRNRDRPARIVLAVGNDNAIAWGNLGEGRLQLW
jgi:hypothetical protein